MAQMWYDFVVEVDPEQANYMRNAFSLNDEYEARLFIQSIIDDDAIYLSLRPFTTIVDIDRIAAISKKFPWLKPYTVSVPIEDSNGEVRYVETRRPLVVGKIYNLLHLLDLESLIILRQAYYHILKWLKCGTIL